MSEASIASFFPTEPVMVETPTIACDGGDGPLGHPRVFLRLVDGAVSCPYCSRRYLLKPGPGHAAH